jgi:hypothetical protein
MELTEENYFSKEASKIYTGSSEIKDFLKCEACALAKLRGEWIEESSTALKQSSYIDAWMSNELEDFKKENADVFTKQGTLKSEYKLAENIIEQIKEDSMFMKYITAGENQVIMTGEISNVPIKIKIDCYHKDKCITDLKCVKDFNLIFNEKTKQRENFIDYYQYTIQAAIYQEIVKQNTGKQLPFIIAACTKQKYSQRALLQIPQEELDLKLEFLKQYLPHLQDLKQGKIKPISCNNCEWCISKQKCNKIYFYDDYFKER